MGPAQKRVLEVIIDDHLRRKTKLGEGGKEWLGNVQVHLETFESFFGAQRDLADIELRGLEDYRAHLFTLPNGRGGTLTTGSIAQYLNSASNLYERAIKDQLLDAGKNLVALLPPLEIKRVETPFLELDEMAEVLRFAFEEYEAARDDLAIPFVAVILALLALTGLREKEALGLLRSDVDLRRRIIHVRPNHFRPRSSRSCWRFAASHRVRNGHRLQHRGTTAPTAGAEPRRVVPACHAGVRSDPGAASRGRTLDHRVGRRDGAARRRHQRWYGPTPFSR